MNNWLPSPGKAIAFVLVVFALGLGGVVLAFGQEIIEWMKFGRELVQERRGATPTGAALAPLAHYLTARWF